MSDDIYVALSNVIDELQPVTKNADNPYFNSKYADLNQLLRVIKPLCKKHGITITQLPQSEAVAVSGSPVVYTLGIKTILRHPESKTFIQTSFTLPCNKLDPQAAGSAISYSKRYALKAIFMLEDTDDDGNDATFGGQDVKTPTPKQQPAKQQLTIVEQCIAEISRITDIKSLNAYYKNSIEELSVPEAEKLQILKAMTKRKTEIGDK